MHIAAVYVTTSRNFYFTVAYNKIARLKCECSFVVPPHKSLDMSKLAYVTWAWTEKDNEAGCAAIAQTFLDAGFTIYPWYTPGGVQTESSEEQHRRVCAWIDSSRVFVFLTHPTDHHYPFSASRLYMAYALSKGVPVVFVDPLHLKRTKETGGAHDGYHMVLANVFSHAYRKQGQLTIVPTLEEAIAFSRGL